MIRRAGRPTAEVLPELLRAAIARAALAEIDALPGGAASAGCGRCTSVALPVRRRGGAARRSPACRSATRRAAIASSSPGAIHRHAISPTTATSCAPPMSCSIAAERRAHHRRRARAAPPRRRAAASRTTGAARRGDRPRRMAGGADRAHRPRLHGPAAGGADHLDAHAPEIFRLPRPRRQARAALPPRRQHGADGRRHGDRRRQRARAARAPLRRQLLLGPGPQGHARERACRSSPSASSTPSSAPSLDKVGRVDAARPRRSSPHVPGADAAKAVRAAELAKADLSTGMVGEFPELQGIMGRYYALQRRRAAGGRRRRSPSITRRSGPNDRCPTRAGQRRRGARRQDRHAGRLLRHRREADRLQGSLRAAPRGARRHPPHPGERAAPAAAAGCSHGHRHWRRTREGRCGTDPTRRPARLLRRPPEGRICASRACATISSPRCSRLGDEDDLVRLLARVEALDGFLKTEDGANLLTAYRRAANIVRIEEKKDGRAYAERARPDAAAPSRRKPPWRQRLSEAARRSAAALAREAFRRRHGGAGALCARRSMNFSTSVTVNCDDADAAREPAAAARRGSATRSTRSPTSRRSKGRWRWRSGSTASATAAPTAAPT